jgi:molecular chaperone HtpG
LLDSQQQPSAEADSKVATFLAFAKQTLGEAVSDVRSSDRLRESAVCLVASEAGPDRQLQKLLAGAGRLTAGTKPILEINPHHELIASLASLGSEAKDFKEDAVHLLFDEARVLDGEPPVDPRAFSDRLGRLMSRGLRSGAPPE